MSLVPPPKAPVGMGERLENKRNALGLSKAEAVRQVAATGAGKPRSANWDDWIKKADPSEMQIRTLLALATVLQTTVEYLATGRDSRAPLEPAPEVVALVNQLRAETRVEPEEAATLTSVRFTGIKPTLPLIRLWHSCLVSLRSPKS